ncbi:helix-turn-helix domain-containing protein [Acetobacterium tundrae]|uniref:Helix-turn-helix domain-containing protein n=1 Tax=Acetobacterium tundrae TaxID=132932 RepID=A0ABR6WJY6_9FIRM|nr:helix-turn-helix transcriptional regulator [Acetobacterium tundrae]MBC3796465.1 helix-turn-helix domain-containing protein [Acetobacterium tundrae]
MFGQRLKVLRESKGMTQQELADILNLSVGTVGMYEIDKRLPNNKNREKIAKYFNVSSDYLLGNTDDPTPARDLERDLLYVQDVESQWHAFVNEYSNGTSMFYQYENVDDEQKLAIMEEYKEKLEKKKKKVAKFMDFSDEVIDEALNFAAYNDEQRKKKGDI